MGASALKEITSKDLAGFVPGFLVALIITSLFQAYSARAQEPQAVAVQLVLALDSSNSISDEEFDLQLAGLAEAFRDEEVIAAIERAGSGDGSGGVAVAVFHWSNAQHQSLTVPWRRLVTAADCLALAEALLKARRELKGGTAISAAVDYALALIEASPFESAQKIVDISGDGPDLHIGSIRMARDRAVTQGITINALAIIDDRENLARYFKGNLIGGPGAFVTTANHFGDYPPAIKRKLLRELNQMPLARLEGEQQARRAPK